jgi:hypothetical protein
MNLSEKILGVYKLEPKVFRALEQEHKNILLPGIVVLLVALITSYIYKSYFLRTVDLNVSIIFLAGIWLFVNWYLLTYVMYFVSTKLFPESGTPQVKCFSIVAFSYLPELLKILIFFSPKLILVTSWGSFIWVIACQVVGLREIYKFKSLWKSLGVVLLSYVIQILTVVILLIVVMNFIR